MVLKLSVVLVLALVALGVASVLVAGTRWRAAIRDRDAAVTAHAGNVEPLDRATLPDPVVRYLERAITPGSPAIGVARLRQTGTFRMDEGGDGWRPFDATEVMSAGRPAFYWDARIRMAPGIGVRVRDAYVEGSAEMVGRVLGVVPVVNAEDDAGLRKGSLARYLAEAAWIPTRLGAGPGLTWRGLDATSAEATLVDRGTTVTLRFTFDDAGDLVEVAGLRPREVEGSYVDTPWIGRFSDHGEAGGYRIPRSGQVSWVIDGEERPYWRGRIEKAEFIPFREAPTTSEGGGER